MNALNGDYTFRGPNDVVHVWSIASKCDTAGNYSGEARSSNGQWVGVITRQADGPWMIDRADVADAWRCDDTGESITTDIHYRFDPVTLAGMMWIELPAGTCGLTEPKHFEDPISLTKA